MGIISNRFQSFQFVTINARYGKNRLRAHISVRFGVQFGRVSAFDIPLGPIINYLWHKASAGASDADDVF